MEPLRSLNISVAAICVLVVLYQQHKHNLKAHIEIKTVLGWTLSKEVIRHHSHGARLGWDEETQKAITTRT
jgi:energy-converting hydrogenase Eha subunit E